MDDRIEAGGIGQRSGQVLGDVGLDDPDAPISGPAREIVSAPSAEIVERDNPAACGDQPVDGVRADKPRPAGDERAAALGHSCLHPPSPLSAAIS